MAERDDDGHFTGNGFTDGDRPRPRKAGFPVWGWVLIAVGTFAALAVGGCVLVSFVLWAGVRTAPTVATPADTPAEQPPVQKQQPARATISRSDLKQWLQNIGQVGDYKNTVDVKARFGPPDSTTETPAGQVDHISYHYARLTVDTDGSGKVDMKVVIEFTTASDPPRYLNVDFFP